VTVIDKHTSSTPLYTPSRWYSPGKFSYTLGCMIHPVDKHWSRLQITVGQWTMVYCFIWLSQQTGTLQEAVALSKPTTILNIRAVREQCFIKPCLGVKMTP